MSHICRLNEEMRNETAEMKSVEIAMKMLKKGKLAYEEIAEYSGLTLEEAQKFAENQKDKPVTA